jgi:peroxiredoxin
LPLSATYVLDQNGVIQFAFAKEDYTLRAEPKHVLTVVKGLMK